MNVGIFNKKYVARRFGKPIEKKGFLKCSSEDFVISLNVHPLGTDQLQALPEGQRTIKRLEAQSSVEMLAADESSEQKGDLLFYQGRWYECVSSQLWDHTVLSHWNLQFVLVPEDGSVSYDIKPPTINEKGERTEA